MLTCRTELPERNNENMRIKIHGIGRVAPSISAAALLTMVAGCTATSGLTYDVRSDETAGKTRYTIECLGLFESVYSCVDTAKRICMGKHVVPMDGATGAPRPFDPLNSPRKMTFLCEDRIANVNVHTEALKPVATVRIGTDVLFGFDRSDMAGITKLGRIQLRKAMADLGASTPEQLIVSGYTDRLGSDAYNRALSARRAEAVKQFLLEHGVQVPIVAIGYGKRNPGTSCAIRERAALIDCLSPDRVVEVTSMGRGSR
ncbi:hypothetical protein WK72_11750 [Burkholderia ubonensis]|nr:hypothetical protein WK72_11750 [Burkholderia ubonensis]